MSFYGVHGGCVLTFAINYYVYITIHDRFDEGYRIGYSKNEEVDSINEIQHPLVRHSLKKLQIDHPLEITSIADVPSRGSGLGSSSAFTVGLLKALHVYKGADVSNTELAEEACVVEIEMAKEPIGKQDQYACALGGINFVEFHSDQRVSASKVELSLELRESFLKHMLLFYTGVTRHAGPLLREQSENSSHDPQVVSNLLIMKALAMEASENLLSGKFEQMGKSMDESWRLKKTLNQGVTSDLFDMYYSSAIKAGAWGGKLLGAGGGGFLLFLAPQDKQNAIIGALSSLRHVSFEIDMVGSKTIYASGA